MCAQCSQSRTVPWERATKSVHFNKKEGLVSISLSLCVWCKSCSWGSIRMDKTIQSCRIFLKRKVLLVRRSKCCQTVMQVFLNWKRIKWPVALLQSLTAAASLRKGNPFLMSHSRPGAQTLLRRTGPLLRLVWSSPQCLTIKDRRDRGQKGEKTKIIEAKNKGSGSGVF